MITRRTQDIWIGQCEAAQEIKERYGPRAADYLVAEKLSDYASAAWGHPEFARELPGFVSEVRRIISASEIREHLARIEREQSDAAPANGDDYRGQT